MFQSRRKIPSEGGFSLIEMLIAVGVLSILMMGIMASVSIGTKSSRNMEATNQVNSAVTEVSLVLQNSSSCTASLQGVPNLNKSGLNGLKGTNQSIAVPELKYANGALIAKTGEKLPGSNLVRVSKMGLENVYSLDVTAGSARFMADLMIQFEKSNQGGVFDGQMTKPRAVPIMISVNDTTGAFESCNSSAITPQQLADITQSVCLGLGGTWNGSICTPPDGSRVCASLGGTWDGSDCTMDVTKACGALGGTMSGSKCNISTLASNPTPPPAPTAAPIRMYRTGTCSASCTLPEKKYGKFGLSICQYSPNKTCTSTLGVGGLVTNSPTSLHTSTCTAVRASASTMCPATVSCTVSCRATNSPL